MYFFGPIIIRPPPPKKKIIIIIIIITINKYRILLNVKSVLVKIILTKQIKCYDWISFDKLNQLWFQFTFILQHMQFYLAGGLGGCS